MFNTNLLTIYNILYFDYIIFQPIHQTQLIFDKDFGIWMLRTYMFCVKLMHFCAEMREKSIEWIDVFDLVYQ